MAGIPALVFYILAVSVSCIHGQTTNESSTVKPEGRIIGGQDAIPNEFPHQILVLRLHADRRGGEICGGSLITSEWILTAAHCVFLNPGETFNIIAGRHSGLPHFPKPDGGQQEGLVKDVYVHPCYNEDDRQINNDIALIKLATPFTLNDKVSVIQLDETDRAKPGVETTALGWGRINPVTIDAYAQALKKATLNIPAAGFCLQTLPTIHEQSQQCVKEMDASVCSGDSGGPLLCKDGGVNYVCGIASFVEDNMNKCIGGYNAFVRVFYYLNWIKDVMATGCTSLKNCVEPRKTTVPSPDVPKTLEGCVKNNNKRGGDNNKNGGMDNNTNSTGASTVYGQPQQGLYLRIILTSLLFTY